MTDEEIQCLVYMSIISADNPQYTEEVKQEIIERHHLIGRMPVGVKDWRFVLRPIGDDEKIEKLVALLT